MVEMLHDPQWVPSHLLQLAGYLALTLALLGFWRVAAHDPAMRRWSRLAAVGASLQSVEMAFHLAAVVDADHLAAGAATPVLTTHLALAVIAYPLFAATMIGLIWVGARTRELGRPMIAWFGILGAVAHGLAAPLVAVFHIERARMLFPAVLLLAGWAVAAAAWRRPALPLA